MVFNRCHSFSQVLLILDVVFCYHILLCNSDSTSLNDRSAIQKKYSERIDFVRNLFDRRLKDVLLKRTERRVPPYMIDLYHTIVDKNGQRRRDFPTQGNIVRSYFSQETERSKVLNNEYYFHLADLEKHEVIERAELRLFKQKNFQRKDKTQHFFKVEVRDKFSNAVVCLRLISVQGFGWEPFSLTSLVRRWVNNATENKGITVRVRSVFEDGNKLHFASDFHRKREPILVVFSSDGRQISQVNDTGISEEQDQELNSGRSKRRQRNPSRPSCKKVDMIVDVTKINWDNWILQPKIFNAYRCEGTCGVYSSKYGGSQTNHATVQAILAETGLRQHRQTVQLPCCAPKQLQSMSLLLYENVGGTIVVKLKSLEEMIVKSCACL